MNHRPDPAPTSSRSTGRAASAPPWHRLRRGLAAGFVALALLAVTACSDDGGGEEAAPDSLAPVTVVPSDGDRCTDEPADLDIPAGLDPAQAGEWAGVDLVQAIAVVDGDQLVVILTTAGPIDDAPAPTFVVAQGEPLEPLSFELRLTRTAEGWSPLLVTWPSRAEERRALDLDVQVEGTTLRTAVPLDELPPIALTLQFGAAAEPAEGRIVIDDCSNLNQ